MLGSKAIYEAIQEGDIIISPFLEKHLGPNSYDLRLGSWHVRQKSSGYSTSYLHSELVDAIDSSSSEEVVNKYNRDLIENGGILLDDPIDGSRLWRSPREAQGGIIWLRPGELILGHTLERVGCYNNITGEMSSRSSMMRHGISVCIDAGLGDVGFDSKWTMEISNHTRHLIGLRVGMRIAQMKFHRIEGPGKDYASKGGTYGQGEWHPGDMIPRSSIM